MPPLTQRPVTHIKSPSQLSLSLHAHAASPGVHPTSTDASSERVVPLSEAAPPSSPGQVPTHVPVVGPSSPQAGNANTRSAQNCLRIAVRQLPWILFKCIASALAMFLGAKNMVPPRCWRCYLRSRSFARGHEVTVLGNRAMVICSLDAVTVSSDCGVFRIWGDRSLVVG